MTLQEVRLKAGLSQSQLAKLANVNYDTLKAYEVGKRNINGAKLSVLCKLCIALNCSISDILTDEELKSDLEKVKFFRKEGV